MNQLSTLVFTVLALVSCQGTGNPGKASLVPVDFSKVSIQDSFWSPLLERHHDTTIAVCIDQIENQTGRIGNFERVAKGGQHQGLFFDDSDVYKALEGMAYSLINNPDPALEAKCDDWIEKIAGAQRSDGYIDTWFLLAKPGEEWTDMDKHELYCTGHMIEAAIAYYRATGKRQLLDVAIKMVDNAMTHLGPGKKDWVPGHEEIELALVRLYQLTQEPKYLDFARWLLEERGHGYGFYSGRKSDAGTQEYYQDREPVRDLSDVYGHAVRAMYLYSGMADVAAQTHDQGYLDALDRLWNDVVLRNMYITGGIGQSASNEGITEDFDLPNLEAYCETCASVGMVLWNWRMNLMIGDAKYVDVLERSMYNGALAGISLSGDRFFYVNPLESRGDHHRQAWYGCACCPSQICRFLPSIGNYVYGVSKDAVRVNLYLGNTAEISKNVTLEQDTQYPWNGSVALTVHARGRLHKSILLRIPGWCKSWRVTVDGNQVQPAVEKGYAVLPGPWKDGDRIELELEMPIEVVAADERVREDVGKRAVQRGPLVYCLEEVDNPAGFDALTLSPDAVLSHAFLPDLLGGIERITAEQNNGTLTFVPYYAWDNRAPGKMKVWVGYPVP